VGARNGTVLTGDLGPTEEWNYLASVHYNLVADGTPEDLAARNYRDCGNISNFPGFYNFLICLMTRSLDPLELRVCPPLPAVCDPALYKDDMVVSAFSVQAINRAVVTLIPPAPAGSGTYMTVVGRWPHNANECGFNAAGATVPQEPRDPFDFSSNQNDDELTNYLDTAPERQRGFVYLLQHRLFDNSNCYGSEWTIAEVEQLMNLPNFPGYLNQTVERSQFLNQGMVLVEIFWQHSPLLSNPVFNPVFNILGNNTVISVWAAFPVPAAEPRIRFD
jgi:hypothetical protein